MPFYILSVVVKFMLVYFTQVLVMSFARMFQFLFCFRIIVCSQLYYTTNHGLL